MPTKTPTYDSRTPEHKSILRDVAIDIARDNDDRWRLCEILAHLTQEDLTYLAKAVSVKFGSYHDAKMDADARLHRLEHLYQKIAIAKERWCREGTVDDPEEMWIEIPDLLNFCFQQMQIILKDRIPVLEAPKTLPDPSMISGAK